MTPVSGAASPALHAQNARTGRRWAAAIAALAVALTLVPYLVGNAQSYGRTFMWLGYNLDDSCVYLSWMRQAADGAVRTLNLFTTDPQHGMAPNPLFWVLGRIAAVAHLPLIAVYHGARILCGFALLLVVWELICALILNQRARQLAFLFICFSSGLGWLPFWWDGPLPAPVDMWQPEAITFLSLYLSPLFCFSMCLQAALVHLLLLGERTGKMRYGIYAGFCGFVLGLTHTYDVITMSAVWCAFLIAHTMFVVCNGLPAKEIIASWVRGFVAGLITLPAVAYIAYQLKTEAVFQARANVETLTPPLHWILLGYGITLLLAILGAAISSREVFYEPPSAKKASAWTTGFDALLLLVLWAIVNVSIAYLPLSFQRKLMQGAHLSIALLAGIGAAWIWYRIDAPVLRRRFLLFALAATAVLCPTNVMFMVRDANNYALGIAQTKLHRPYLQSGEIAALEWVRTNSPPGTAVQPLPWAGVLVNGARSQVYTRDTALMCFTPGLIDRPVYCGHWGETPHFREKLAPLTAFGTRFMDDTRRIALLHDMHVKYLVFSQKRAADNSLDAAEATDDLLPMFRGRIPVPGYLVLRYTNADADVYEVRLVRPPTTGAAPRPANAEGPSARFGTSALLNARHVVGFVATTGTRPHIPRVSANLAGGSGKGKRLDFARSVCYSKYHRTQIGGRFTHAVSVPELGRQSGPAHRCSSSVARGHTVVLDTFLNLAHHYGPGCVRAARRSHPVTRSPSHPLT